MGILFFRHEKARPELGSNQTAITAYLLDKKDQIMNISFAEFSLPKTGSLILLVTEGRTLTGRAAEVDKATAGAVSRAAKTSGFTGKAGSSVEILGAAGVAVSRISLIGLGKASDLDALAFEKVGGEIVGKLESARESAASIAIDEIKGGGLPAGDTAARIAFGATLRAYRFDKYKTGKAKEDTVKLGKLTVLTPAVAAARRAFAVHQKIAEGINIARDLVNEPANILYPVEFARRAKALAKVGVKVEVLSEAQMLKLGMGSLLGVGQGSVRDSQLVVMTWSGGKSGDAPVAFVGKGVTFDTGGISIKPAGGMEDMKGDMGGAACVTGLLYALGARKAKVNAVGIIGLVENMPDANAQRPGDIVTSMSGQTIEVINTDAEGRLVLADALWYTQNRFKPKFMVDLATLTGAIMVALGKEYAGLFSYNDKLATEIYELGLAERDKG